MPNTRFRHLARAAIVLVLGLASMALTGCVDAVRDESAATPSAEQSTAAASAVAASPEPTPTNTEDTRPRITGDYKADLAALDWEPAPEDFEYVTGGPEEHICEDSMADNEMFVGYNSWENGIERYTEVLGADVVRVVVEYNCANRADAVENVLVDLGY